MRKVLIPLAGAALVALLVIGLVQAGGKDKATGDDAKSLTRAQVSRPVTGANPEIAALRRQVNVLQGGGEQAFDRQLRKLRGHPVVVNLWASWCAPCRFEVPFFQRQSAARASSIAFLGVNTGDNRGDASGFLRTHPMPYPSFEDPGQKLLERLGARGLPVTVFYDAKGKQQFVHQGVFLTQGDLAKAIDRYAKVR